MSDEPKRERAVEIFYGRKSAIELESGLKQCWIYEKNGMLSPFKVIDIGWELRVYLNGQRLAIASEELRACRVGVFKARFDFDHDQLFALTERAVLELKTGEDLARTGPRRAPARI